MADDAGLEGEQHGVLQVVVVLEETLLGATGGGDGGGVGGGVVVDGQAVDVVDGADEVVDAGRGGEGTDQGGEVGADKLGLEADEDVDGAGVLGAQALGLDEVGLVSGGGGRRGSFWGRLSVRAGRRVTRGRDGRERDMRKTGEGRGGSRVEHVVESRRGTSRRTGSQGQVADDGRASRKRRTHLLGVEIALVVARHVLGQAHGLEAEGDGVADNVLELVDGVSGTELARVGMHGESHGAGGGGGRCLRCWTGEMQRHRFLHEGRPEGWFITIDVNMSLELTDESSTPPPGET